MVEWTLTVLTIEEAGEVYFFFGVSEAAVNGFFGLFGVYFK